MDRWKIPYTAALQLMGHASGLTKKGTLPRFKLTGGEAEAFLALHEIDNALAPLGLPPDRWLRESIVEKPFGGAAPLAFLIRTGLAGMRDVSRFVLRNSLKMSMSV